MQTASEAQIEKLKSLGVILKDYTFEALLPYLPKTLPMQHDNFKVLMVKGNTVGYKDMINYKLDKNFSLAEMVDNKAQSAAVMLIYVIEMFGVKGVVPA